MFNKDLLLPNKIGKYKKLWSRFKLTIGKGTEPGVGGAHWGIIWWCKNSGGSYGNVGSYTHISGVDLTKVNYTQSDQTLFKLGDGAFYFALGSVFSVINYDNPYKTYLSNTLYDIIDDTFGTPMFYDYEGINISPYLQTKIFFPQFGDHVGKTIQISVYVWDF